MMSRLVLLTAVGVVLWSGSSVGAVDGLWEPDPEGLYTLYTDGLNDRLLRRTSATALGIGPEATIELLQYRIGNFMPADPETDLFTGQFYAGIDQYFRMDILLNGLVVPPGPQSPGNYDPFKYGYRPLYGVFEMDVDGMMTGGELDYAQDYMLGNMGRFGSKFSNGSPAYANRTARQFAHTQQPFEFDPQSKRTGHDFELMFNGQDILSIDKVAGDGDDNFERGETWVVSGHFFCRAHGYEFPDFWSGSGSDGVYCPEVKVQFSHNYWRNKTTVSFVFPMINFTEPDDYDDSNEVSIMEALNALVDASANVPTGNPEDALIEDWAWKYPIMYTLSNVWNLKLMVSTATTMEPTDGQYFVWTDLAPNHTPGDFDGDGDADADDTQAFEDFVALRDGDPDYDTDGDPNNGTLVTPGYPKNFALWDRNGNGRVEPGDSPQTPLLPGDLDTDNDVDADDFRFLAPLFAGPEQSAPPAGVETGDFQLADLDFDGDVDVGDIQRLQASVTR